MTINTNREAAEQTETLTWSSRIEVNHLPSHDQTRSPKNGRQQDERPRTSKIEREILWAVVVLYAAIIACFAGLHVFGAAQVG